ncbi:MAG: pilus assembly protein, partial [Novosphingobium sp.]
CISADSVTTEPGAMMNVIRFLNTRFDIYDNADAAGNNCYSGNMCPPSDNSRKDLVQKGTAALAQNDCQLANNPNQPGWKLSPFPYRPTQAETYARQIADGDRAGYPDHMGYPRDICHAFAKDTSALAGGCGRIGSGIWDIDAYWRANYGSAYGGQLGTAPSRYAVYEWERTHAASSRTFTSAGDTYTDHKSAVCRTGSTPGATTPDRRVIPVAVVNCTGMTGRATRTPLDFVDVFLVEPSADRSFGGQNYTQFGDIYVEVIGRTGQGTGGAAQQYVRRDKPYLVR